MINMKAPAPIPGINPTAATAPVAPAASTPVAPAPAQASVQPAAPSAPIAPVQAAPVAQVSAIPTPAEEAIPEVDTNVINSKYFASGGSSKPRTPQIYLVSGNSGFKTSVGANDGDLVLVSGDIKANLGKAIRAVLTGIVECHYTDHPYDPQNPNRIILDEQEAKTCGEPITDAAIVSFLICAPILQPEIPGALKTKDGQWTKAQFVFKKSTMNEFRKLCDTLRPYSTKLADTAITLWTTVAMTKKTHRQYQALASAVDTSFTITDEVKALLD